MFKFKCELLVLHQTNNKQKSHMYINVLIKVPHKNMILKTLLIRLSLYLVDINYNFLNSLTSDFSWFDL